MSGLSFAPKVAPGDDYVYVCQAKDCTRFFVPWLSEQYTIEEQDRWLVAPHKNDLSILIVRCPQHISTSALSATIGATPGNISWAERVKEEDRETNEKWSPATPYPLDPRLMWTSTGRLSVSFKGRSKLAAQAARRIVAG